MVNPILNQYAKVVRSLVNNVSKAITVRIELAKLRNKAVKELEKLSEEDRLDWELKYLAGPISKMYASNAYISQRGTVTFKKRDNTQCTASIHAFADLRLSPEEIEEKAQQKADKANARQKAQRAKAKAYDREEEEQEDVVVEIIAKPTAQQLRAIVDLCSRAQLEKLSELVQERLAEEE